MSVQNFSHPASTFTGLPMQSAPKAAGGLTPPKAKTRRGRGGKPKGSPATHLANLNAAHKAGNHAAVKSHAFSLIRSLPQPDPDPATLSAQDAGQDVSDSMPATGGATHSLQASAAPAAPASSPPKTPPSSGLGRLAGLLQSRKTR